MNRIRGVSDEVENAYWRDVGTIDAYYEGRQHVDPQERQCPASTSTTGTGPSCNGQLSRPARQAGLRRRQPARRRHPVGALGRLHHRGWLRQGLGAGAQRLHRRGRRGQRIDPLRQRLRGPGRARPPRHRRQERPHRARRSHRPRPARATPSATPSAKAASPSMQKSPRIRSSPARATSKTRPPHPAAFSCDQSRVAANSVALRCHCQSRSSFTGTSTSRRARTRGPTRCRASRRQRRTTIGTPASTPSRTAPTPSRAFTTARGTSAPSSTTTRGCHSTSGRRWRAGWSAPTGRSRRVCGPLTRSSGCGSDAAAPWPWPTPTPSCRCSTPPIAERRCCGGWPTSRAATAAGPRACGCPRRASRPRRSRRSSMWASSSRSSRPSRSRPCARRGPRRGRPSTAIASTRAARTSGRTATGRGGASPSACSMDPFRVRSPLASPRPTPTTSCAPCGPRRRGRASTPTPARRGSCCAPPTGSSGATTRSSPISRSPTRRTARPRARASRSPTWRRTWRAIRPRGSSRSRPARAVRARLGAAPTASIVGSATVGAT